MGDIQFNLTHSRLARCTDQSARLLFLQQFVTKRCKKRPVEVLGNLLSFKEVIFIAWKFKGQYANLGNIVLVNCWLRHHDFIMCLF